MKRIIVLTGIVMLLMTGCQGDVKQADSTTAKEPVQAKAEITIKEETEQIGVEDTIAKEPKAFVTMDENAVITETEEVAVSKERPFVFRDVFGEEYETVILPDVEPVDFDPSLFVKNGEKMSYNGDPRYSFRLGIDVSYHQNGISWEKVKADGYEFVIIRVGYRGYGKAGNICADKRFKEYITKAHEVGLDVGVYFFAQAINEEEAVEEADFVLKQLEDETLELPVVYDPESILDDVARTDDVTGEQFTDNTIAFCERVKEAGYEPMVYANMKWEAFLLELPRLKDYPMWYADYEDKPQTPYAFSMWQYTNTGRVSGVSGDVDIDIQLIPQDTSF